MLSWCLFCYCDKVLWQKQLNGGRLYFSLPSKVILHEQVQHYLVLETWMSWQGKVENTDTGRETLGLDKWQMCSDGDTPATTATWKLSAIYFIHQDQRGVLTVYNRISRQISLVSVGGLQRGAVSGCKHLGERSCLGFFFLLLIFSVYSTNVCW